LPTRVLPPFAVPATPLRAVGKGRAPLLSVVAHHAITDCDMEMAFDLSDLLRESITQGCRNSYLCGYNSLSVFCKTKKLCAMPVDAITLCAWMLEKAKTIKVRSVIKYMCGIRFAHILEGYEWTLTNHALVQTAIKSLKKRYPTSNIMQKVPLSLDMLMKMCKCMCNWPHLSFVSFNDLAWAAASCIAFFACLRGGEFFVQPKSERPVLTGAAVTIKSAPSGDYVYIEVPSPKTRKDLISIPAVAASPGGVFSFDPVLILTAYRQRAVERGIDVLGKNAAFKSKDGKPINREFMISRAEALRTAAKIVILGTDGKSIKVSAASWRAGFVLSARQAGIVQENIRTNGRWTSVGGPIPYTVDTLDTYQSMTKALVLNQYTRTRKGAGASGPSAGGQFASSALLL
jgi:hypothetical protein